MKRTDDKQNLITKQANAIQKSFGAWKDENYPDLMTPEDTIAYIRKLRETDTSRLSNTESKERM